MLESGMYFLFPSQRFKINESSLVIFFLLDVIYHHIDQNEISMAGANCFNNTTD